MTTTEPSTTLDHVDLTGGGSVDLWTYDDHRRLTVTAWDEHGSLVGMAWCELTGAAHPVPAAVEVAPAERGRGIGTVLLRALIAEASERGISWLTWTRPADDPAVRHLLAATDAICARRVAAGRATSVLFVPAA